MPTWAFADVEGDFGRALLEIAARFNSEVAERLDGGGEKLRRGFLDWLGVQGEAARPARMPVVFKLADAAQEPVFASPPVRMQVEVDGTSVVFEAETETDIRLVPGRLDIIVGVDADKDAIYFPPPGLSDLKPFEQLPTQWQLKSFASAGAVKLQLEPAAGFSKGMTIEAGGRHYRIDEIDNGIVTIDPPLEADLEISEVRKVETFAPFDGITRDRQEHALYIGHNDLLNIEAAATIDVVGAGSLVDGVKWQYWGKSEKSDEPGWQNLEIVENPKSDALYLKKPIGAVEPRKIGEINSRWIRATTRNLADRPEAFSVDSLQLRINCETNPPCPSPDSAEQGVTAEAMANTTPLVLDDVFFPLGKFPRQFDAFYLGSGEAFSKKGATAKLCFEMADRTFSALAAVREGAFANTVIAGVARDRSLHLLSINPATGALGKFRDRGPLQPPRPRYLGAEEDRGSDALDIRPKWRSPVWPENASPFAGFLVGTSAGDRIWIWRENLFAPTVSGWIEFGKLSVDGSTPGAAVEGLVYLAGAPALLVALFDQRVFMSEWSTDLPVAAWNEIDTKDGNTTIKLTSIVPVLVDDGSGRLVTSRTAGMIGISDQKKLFQVAANGACTLIPKFSAFDFNPAVRPVAIEIAGALNIAAVTEAANVDPPKLVAHNDGAGNPKEEPLEDGAEVVASLEALLIGGNTFHVLATVNDDAGTRLTSWAPFAVPPLELMFNSRIGPAGTVADAGAPLSVGGVVVIPAGRADILTSRFDTLLRLQYSDDLEIGVVVPDSVPQLAINDLIVRFDGVGKPVSREITQLGITKDGQVLYEIDAAFPAAASNGLDAYDLSATLGGTFDNPDLTLDAADMETDVGDYLWIDDELYEIDSITSNNNDRIATLNTPNDNGVTPAQGNNDYVRPIQTEGRVAHFMELDTSAGGSGDWDATLLNRIRLVFPGGKPYEQRATPFRLTGDNKPEVVVLDWEFQVVPANPVDFLVDAAFSEWTRNAGDTSTNAELSWEYWNGKGWWKLDVALDETQDLKTTGVLRFDVPSDIASSDWAGKTNHWIRARLIGGDYGREIVTVKTKNLPGNVTEQTIDRSSESIGAPSVLNLNISYRVCKSVQPTFVLAEDSGLLVDQSDANRTPGAIVEAFVPVGLMLGRLSRAAAPAEEAHECLPDCDCRKQGSSENNGPAALAASPPAPVIPKGGRSLFIGLDAIISAGPVSVLLMVEKENDHLAFAPMTIEALVAGQFKPIVADDATRALGESGVLLMSFAVPPKLGNLFGRPRTWLRLTPKVSGENWGPSIRGAYLNAVFASSKETLTRELIGSSDGSQNLTLRLARPPVLRDTLELRVREPLGEEERLELAAADPDLVLTDPDGLRGYWVRWKKVTDPDDEAASERIFALDEASGEIRFGDGMHGRIPPIGRNNIVAFSYSRTEAGPPGSDVVPANSVKARTLLNLVSPVESVESVTAADQAAGGAPPESDDRVLRYGYARFRHRGRAVTARDIEDLALQSSPDIAQARAVVESGRIRLVVVMKGRRPKPSAAQARELRRFLLEASPVSLAAPRALRIEGPGIRRLRVDLVLKIERLDYAAQVSKWVNTELERFFDSGLGGFDRDGWPLGLNPSEDDIAFALSDAPLLDGISDIKRFEIPADGRESVWPASIKATDIVVLDDDPVRIRFETAEVTG
jgi:hypothetical protein